LTATGRVDDAARAQTRVRAYWQRVAEMAPA